MGYKVIIVSLGCLRVSMKAVWDYAVDLMHRKEQAEKDFEEGIKGHPMEDFNKFAGIPKIRELEEKYLMGGGPGYNRIYDGPAGWWNRLTTPTSWLG